MMVAIGSPPLLQQRHLLPMQGPWNGLNNWRLLGGTPGSSAWTSANRAVYLPFSIAAPTLVKRLWLGVGTTGGTNSVDMGIYVANAAATGAAVVRHGGTTVGTASQVQFLDVTDTVLIPGQYYLAIAMNGTTATTQRETASNEWPRAMGVLLQASAYTLPSSMTGASSSGFNAVPICGFATTSSP